MAAQIIDGKAIAAKVRDEVRIRAEAFARRAGRPPGLEVVLVGEDPASAVYVRNKERAASASGIRGAVHRLGSDVTQVALIELIQGLNRDEATDGILIQLPLSRHLDALAVLDAVRPDKDADGLHAVNAGLLAVGRPGLRPCTPSGCMRLLDEVGVPIEGARAVVVGRSNLVGKPLALMLLDRHATVTLAHSRTKDLAGLCRDADILVAAVGKEGVIHGDWVKPGATVLDVGTNRSSAGKLIGDVDFAAAAARAAHITPVPGGVGPMTIAMLLANTVTAAEGRLAPS